MPRSMTWCRKDTTASTPIHMNLRHAEKNLTQLAQPRRSISQKRLTKTPADWAKGSFAFLQPDVTSAVFPERK